MRCRLAVDTMEELCTHVVSECMKPFGVVTHCEIHANNETVSMIVDGEVTNLTNYWCTGSNLRYPGGFNKKGKNDIHHAHLGYEEGEDELNARIEEIIYYPDDGHDDGDETTTSTNFNNFRDIDCVDPGTSKLASVRRKSSRILCPVSFFDL